LVAPLVEVEVVVVMEYWEPSKDVLSHHHPGSEQEKQ
jgi:hypothetical protein